MGAEGPLDRERILVAAEEVIRRFGPAKANVVDVARALGVSHAAVYRHIRTKAELRDLVVGRWVEATMGPLRAVVEETGPAPERLRRMFDTLIAAKRRRVREDPEMFRAYRALAAETPSVTEAHVQELIGMVAEIVRAGVAEGAFKPVDAMAAGRALLWGTVRFHHPAHAGEWGGSGVDEAFEDVWGVLMVGLRE